MKKVSVIIPVYNSSKYILECVDSVLNQTYKNLEIIIIDDKSQDNSVEIIKQINDKRIILIEQPNNLGVALTRNRGIEVSTGSYICFIDSDDKWKTKKIEKQLKFMNKKNCAFSYTGYEFADKNCIPNGKKVFVPNKISYNEALKNTTISTITVMFDMEKLSKEDIYMENIKSEDTACWWKVLKKVKYAYGLNEILSYYRKVPKSLSSNKFKAIIRTWNLYKHENINIVKRIYYFMHYIVNAIKRRI